MAAFIKNGYFTRNPPPPFVLDDFPDGERQQTPRLDWLITAALALAALALAALIIVGIWVIPLCLVIKVLG